MQTFSSVITGTGSYLPSEKISNQAFIHRNFYEGNGKRIEIPCEEIIKKFNKITTISNRRHVTKDLVASDIAYFAAREAIDAAGIDRETLDYIIVAHNFGDVQDNSPGGEMVPALASRVKHKLRIKNPYTVAYDLQFGCPGWLQGVIQADYYLKSGDAKKILVIGADTLSRISDPYDRDSMIYADGAGAALLEAKESRSSAAGLLGHKTRSDTLSHVSLLHMDRTFKPGSEDPKLYLKMNGRKVYQYALETVPRLVKKCLEQCGIGINEVDKLLIHQANGKMDDAMLARLFKLYDLNSADIPELIMPMTVSWLGNSSVATLPTLLDLLWKKQLQPHAIATGNILVFASVGAGMNVNCVVYRV